MPVNIPSEEEVLGYFESLSNWGRWGDDDQLGTLNLLSQESTRRGFSTVSEHVAVSCARTVSYEPTLDAPKPALHFMTNSGEGDNPRVAVDFFGMVFHGSTITHMDSLAHFFWKGQMYNGRPSQPGVHVPRVRPWSRSTSPGAASSRGGYWSTRRSFAGSHGWSAARA